MAGDIGEESGAVGFVEGFGGVRGVCSPLLLTCMCLLHVIESHQFCVPMCSLTHFILSAVCFLFCSTPGVISCACAYTYTFAPRACGGGTRCARTHIHTHTHTRTHTRAHAYANTHAHTHTHTHTHTRTHAHTRIHTYTHTHTSFLSQFLGVRLLLCFGSSHSPTSCTS